MRVAIISSLILAAIGDVFAKFNEQSGQNLAVYWGQNSKGHGYTQSIGAPVQKTLGEYCEDESVDIFIISFVVSLLKDGVSGLNLADYGGEKHCNMKMVEGQMEIESCPALAKDIKQCQAKGKKVLLSIGGEVTPESSSWFASIEEANSTADKIWAMYGPVSGAGNAIRPFGDAVVDGIDLDIEVETTHMSEFGARLKENMGNGNYYLTATAECQEPQVDEAAKRIPSIGLVRNLTLDMVFVMFYNMEYCSVAEPGYTMKRWLEWAKSKLSKNSNVKIFLGVPGGKGAASDDNNFLNATALKTKLEADQSDPNFGGIMLWDASQAFNHSLKDTYPKEVKTALLAAKSSAGTGAGSSAAPKPT